MAGHRVQLVPQEVHIFLEGAGGRIGQLGGAVPADGHDPLAIDPENNLQHPVLVMTSLVDLLAGLQINHADRLVRGTENRPLAVLRQVTCEQRVDRGGH